MVADVTNIVTVRSNKIKTILWKVQHEGELGISESNLFHSTNADGKKELRKKLYAVIFILAIN